MKKAGLIAVAAMLCGVPGTVSAAAARGSPVAFIHLGEAADAPLGYLQMCDRDPAACGLRAEEVAANRTACDPDAATSFDNMPASPCGRRGGQELATAAIALTISTDAAPRRSGRSTSRDLLHTVNQRVNRSVLQRSDLAIFGVDEYWRAAGSARGAMGDCEDIALEKRKQLVAAGFAEERLFLAVVYKARVGLHTVLVARTDSGDMLLDSLSAKVRRWHDGGYSWLRIQRPGQPLHWNRLAG